MSNAATTTNLTAPRVTEDAPTIALNAIDLVENVRDRDEAKEEALSKSIALVGLLEPLTVRAADEAGRWVLVAGYTRYHACALAGFEHVPYTVRDHATEHVDRAVENIARTQLNAYEEARALAAALDAGLTEEGAAIALCWPKARVTARLRLLQLPDAAQRMVGEGTIALSAIDDLLAVSAVSPTLLDAVVFHIGENPSDGRQITDNLGWLIGQVVRRGDVADLFVAYLNSINANEIERLRLGKKTTELYARAETLHKQLEHYAYGPPTIRFTIEDIDQARAAGVLIEPSEGAAIICDRSLYRELVKQAIKRTTAGLEDRAKQRAADKTDARAAAKDDPLAGARRERGGALRDATVQGHGANLDLGTALINGLATVDPTDMNVARFFVYALLGPEPISGYGNHGERVQHLAATGVRLVVDEFRTDAAKIRKDGTRGALKVDYGDHRNPERAIAWMWKWIDGATTADELYGRALVVIAAEQHATRLVVPTSQRHPAMRWSSRKGRAQKALKGLAGPHLPKSLAAVERAVARAHREYDQAEAEIRTAATTAMATQDEDPEAQADAAELDDE